MSLTQGLHNVCKNKLKNPKSDKDDFPTPYCYFDKFEDALFATGRMNWIRDKANTIDGACSEKNRKYGMGCTENGSVGIEPRVEGDGLSIEWWIYALYFHCSPPYDKVLQPLFAAKFDEAVKHGMKGWGIFEGNLHTEWFQINIEGKYDYIVLRGKMFYTNEKSHTNHSTVLIVSEPPGFFTNEERNIIKNIPINYRKKGRVSKKWMNENEIKPVDVSKPGLYNLYCLDSINANDTLIEPVNDFILKFVEGEWRYRKQILTKDVEYYENSLVKAGYYYDVLIDEQNITINGKTFDRIYLEHFNIDGIEQPKKKIATPKNTKKIATPKNTKKIATPKNTKKIAEPIDNFWSELKIESQVEIINETNKMEKFTKISQILAFHPELDNDEFAVGILGKYAIANLATSMNEDEKSKSNLENVILEKVGKIEILSKMFASEKQTSEPLKRGPGRPKTRVDNTHFIKEKNKSIIQDIYLPKVTNDNVEWERRLVEFLKKNSEHMSRVREYGKTHQLTPSMCKYLKTLENFRDNYSPKIVEVRKLIKKGVMFTERASRKPARMNDYVIYQD